MSGQPPWSGQCGMSGHTCKAFLLSMLFMTYDFWTVAHGERYQRVSHQIQSQNMEEEGPCWGLGALARASVWRCDSDALGIDLYLRE